MTYREQQLRIFAGEFNTDKLGHGYLKHYAAELPDRCRSLLEIGIDQGGSAMMWDAFYGGTKLDLWLLDLYLNPDTMPVREVRNHGWVPVIGDQSSIEVLSSIKRDFEVIVDDGSHNAHHQLISFKHLFLNNLRPGGVYVIEDLHCNKESFYYGGLVKSLDDTPLAMLEKFQRNGRIANPYFNEGEANVFYDLIGSVKIFDDKISFITRKP